MSGWLVKMVGTVVLKIGSFDDCWTLFTYTVSVVLETDGGEILTIIHLCEHSETNSNTMAADHGKNTLVSTVVSARECA